MTGRRVPLTLSLAIGLILSIVFVGGFAVGAVVQQSRAASSADSSDTSLKDFLQAYHLVLERSYYRPFDRQHLINAAIDGMLSATGDPHTLFLSPTENRVADTQLNGTVFSGIGAIVIPYHGNLQIVAPLPKAPAARAGIHAGDVVTKIDGTSVAHLAGSRAIARIHGPAGTTVRLTLVRGHHAPFTVSVKRAQIPPITAYGRMLAHRLGYIQVISFGDTTSREVGDALTFLTSKHAHALIIDLRSNPGGYVDAAQRVVSLFLAHGVVAYEEGLDRKMHPLLVPGGARATSLPLAVLVDGGTASAAEITAAALHDHGRATLLGTQTYGKGSMQSVYNMADGSSIRITDRLWLTPKRHSIQRVGIRPDIVVEATGAEGDAQRDNQLIAAERYLISHARR